MTKALDQAGRNSNRELIEDLINRTTGSNTAEYWLKQLDEGGIPSGPINRLSQALVDPQLLYRNMVVDLKHPSGESGKGPGNPNKMSQSGTETFDPPPLLGQDTDAILKSILNYQPDRIDELRSEGVIG